MSDEELINIAKLARKNAVANVTGYSVGAALLAESETVYIGANIEESTIIGLSNCAERVALQNAMSHGERKFSKIAIVGGNVNSTMIDDNISPCGVCLQYMLDFYENMSIITFSNGKITTKNIKDYLNS